MGLDPMQGIVTRRLAGPLSYHQVFLSPYFRTPEFNGASRLTNHSHQDGFFPTSMARTLRKKMGGHPAGLHEIPTSTWPGMYGSKNLPPKPINGTRCKTSGSSASDRACLMHGLSEHLFGLSGSRHLCPVTGSLGGGWVIVPNPGTCIRDRFSNLIRCWLRKS